jgi:micrococcal nuclease
MVALSAAAVAAARTEGEAATVASVVDGDTLTVTTGPRVRLLQIDTPEVGSAECYSRAAARELRRLLPSGTRIGLEADARLDRVDRYGRRLRYVWRGRLNVNLELVRRGAATVYLYSGERGKHASRLLAAARAARAARRGIWGACRVVWDPTGPATSAGAGSRPAPALGGARCDPSYPGVCIPSPPPDLDCRDVRSIAPFTVRGADPHRFDGDRNGVGCE